MDNIKTLKTEPLRKNTLTIEQIKSLILACPDAQWHWIVILSAVTGLRKSDIDALLISDIDFDGCSVRGIAKKTGKPFEIPLPDNLIAPLRAYALGLPRKRLFLPTNGAKVWGSICTRAGIKATRQDLRRSCATLIHSAAFGGISQGLLQHSAQKTTTDFYIGGGLLRLAVNYVFGSVDWGA